MLTNLHLENFKSWRSTGDLRLAPLTGLFGANSSGKSTLLQSLLLLKQTAESADRAQVLNFGSEKSYVDFGTFRDIVLGRQEKPTQQVLMEMGWKLHEPLKITNPTGEPNSTLFTIQNLNYKVSIEEDEYPQVNYFDYTFESKKTLYKFGMAKKGNAGTKNGNYELKSTGYELKRNRGRGWEIPAPLKNYGFPEQVLSYYQNTSFLFELMAAYQNQIASIYYLGPLRENPHRDYIITSKPQDVGKRGEETIPAIIASKSMSKIGRGPGRGKQKQWLEEIVAEWLKTLGLIESFRLNQITPNRKNYEVLVQRSKDSPEVSITDIGFGISQILPIIVLCYYVPRGSTILLEQPEIHLHPAVQSGLADVFIDAIERRDIQIIFESHSEHLLQRLQLRMAQEKIKTKDVMLYFCQSNQGHSQVETLQLNEYGEIFNWPKDFFGNPLEEAVQTLDAIANRQQNQAQENMEE